MMPLRCLLMAALLSCSVLPALAEDGPPATSPGVPAGPEFWFGAGPHAAVLRVRIHDAHDLDCVLTVQPGCRGEIAAPAGGVVAELLGSPRVVTRWALRHHKVPVVNARIESVRQ